MSIISPGFTIVVTHQEIIAEGLRKWEEFIEAIHDDKVGEYNEDKGIAPISTWNFMKKRWNLNKNKHQTKHYFPPHNFLVVAHLILSF